MDNVKWWNKTSYLHPGSYSRNCFEEDAPMPLSYPATGGRKINSRTIICLVQVLCGPCIVPLLLRYWANGDPTVPWGEWPQDNEIALRCPLFLFCLNATLQQPLTVCANYLYMLQSDCEHVTSNGCISLLQFFKSVNSFSATFKYWATAFFAHFCNLENRGSTLLLRKSRRTAAKKKIRTCC